MKRRTWIWPIAFGYLVVPALGAAAEITDALRETIAQRLPGLVIESVSASPLTGVLEVTYDGGVLYVSDDGRYALTGSLVDLVTREDLTERVLSAKRLRVLAEIPEDRMIVFEPVD